MGYFDFLNPGNWFGGGAGDAPQYNPYDINQGAFDSSGAGNWWEQEAMGGFGDLMGGQRATGEIDMGRANAARGGQTELAGMLMNRARGISDSAAERQMYSGMDQARRQAASVAASAPGMSPALAQRQALRAQNQMTLQGTQQAGAMRAQEQARAEGSLGGLLGQMRGQDIGLETSQAQMLLQAQQMKDSLAARYMAMGMSKAEADRQAQMMMERMQQQGSQFGGSMDMQAWMAQSQAESQKAGALLDMGGAFLGGILPGSGGNQGQPPPGAPY